MKSFTAKQLHNRPQKVYSEAHQEPVKISHRSHGDFLLISPLQVLSKHTNVDGSVIVHLRSLETDIKPAPAQEELTAA